MFSDVIKSSLEAEVVGQTRAVNAVVRGVTRLISGMTPRERMVCAYLFMGPTGTGKTHLIQTLARTLHGDERRVAVVDCGLFAHGDPSVVLASQLGALFQAPFPSDKRFPRQALPLSIVQLEFLERGPKEVCTRLAAVLETGQVTLPDGARGSLENCLVFLTSGLCASEILNEPARIGFRGAPDDEEEQEEDRVFQQCVERAEEHFGSELMGRIDRLIIFHRLQEEHLSEILDRRLRRLDQWLAARSLRCEFRPAARDFLAEKGRRDLRLGARDLLRAHQKFVEFPLADLLVSGRVPAGGVVLVDRRAREEHLHFTVSEAEAGSPMLREICVG